LIEIDTTVGYLYMVRLSSLHDEQVSESSSLMHPHAQKTQETSLVRKEDQE